MNLGNYPQLAARWLSALDEDTLRRARNTQYEALFDAAVALLGLALLGWSPYLLCIFLIFSLWASLFELLFEYLVDKHGLQQTADEAVTIDNARGKVRNMIRRGHLARADLDFYKADHLPDEPEQAETRIKSTEHQVAQDAQGKAARLPGFSSSAWSKIGVQLLWTVYFVGAYSLALIFSMIVELEIPLGVLLLENPDTIVIMSAVLVLRFYGVLRRVHSDDAGAPWLGYIAPVIEIFVFPMLVGFWLIFALLAREVVAIVGGDPKLASAVVFVVLAYALTAARAIVQLRDLNDLVKDLKWLAAQTESKSS